jgi:hypothetical protein
MKVSKIVVACSMAFAAMSAQAVSTGIPATPTNVIFISGASGVDSYMGAVASNQLNVTSYVHTADGNYKAWYGTTKAAIGSLPAASNLLIIKRSAGGSAMGVIPVGRPSKIEVPDWADAAGTGTADATANQFTVGITTAANGRIPDIGVSDVEPKMFSGINAEFGYTALNSTEAGTLTVASWAQLAEGIVATRAVADTAVLSNNWIREALDGHYKDWSKVDTTTDPVIVCRRIEGSGTQAAYNSYFNSFPNVSAYNGYGKVLPKITTDSVGYDVIGGSLGTKADPIQIDPNAYTVFEGVGSGDVRKCLQGAQLGRDVTVQGRGNLYYKILFSTYDPHALGVPGIPAKAIGVLSLDSYTSLSTSASRLTADGKNAAAIAAELVLAGSGDFTASVDGKGVATSNADTNGDFTFRFLNGNGTYDVKNQVLTSATSSGIAPSRANILNSSYDFTVEPTLQMRTADAATLTGAFFTKLNSLLGNPADMVVGSANNGAPLAYAALPALYTKGVTVACPNCDLVADLTRQANTTAPLHVKQ